jgi:hypothetical protein
MIKLIHSAALSIHLKEQISDDLKSPWKVHLYTSHLTGLEVSYFRCAVAGLRLALASLWLGASFHGDTPASQQGGYLRLCHPRARWPLNAVKHNGPSRTA